jgi:hypothetical protein
MTVNGVAAFGRVNGVVGIAPNGHERHLVAAAVVSGGRCS